MRGRRDAKPTLDHPDVQAKARQQADEAELLAQRRQRVVGVDGRDRQPAADHRQARAQSDAQQPATAQRVQRLDHLEAGAGRVGPWIQPVVHALLHVPEQAVEGEGSHDEQDHAAHHVGGPPGRDVEEGQEDREEQQRRPEIPLHDDDAQGDRPHGAHRRQVRERRQAEGPEPGALLRQERPVLGQVPRQEHHQDHLEQLRRLPCDRPDREREAGAVGLAAEHEGQQQQPDPDRRPGVLVGPQPPVRADCEGEGADDPHRDQQPNQLELAESDQSPNKRLLHEVLRQSLHQQQTDPAEHGYRRQQHLVDPATGQDERDVRESHGREIDGEPHRIRRCEVEGRERLAGIPGLELALGSAERRRPDHERRGDDGQQGSLGGPEPGPDPWPGAGERPRLRRDAHERPRSNRRRTSPTWSSSPKPISAMPSTGMPFT